jgi:hypothetical protein
MRNSVNGYKNMIYQRIFMESEEMRKATSDEERNRIWQRQIRQSTQASNQLAVDYNKRFRTEAILLRDELKSRLPDQIRGNHYLKQVDSMYETPANDIGMNLVIDDLEYLAKSLP